MPDAVGRENPVKGFFRQRLARANSYRGNVCKGERKTTSVEMHIPRLIAHVRGRLIAAPTGGRFGRAQGDFRTSGVRKQPSSAQDPLPSALFWGWIISRRDILN